MTSVHESTTTVLPCQNFCNSTQQRITDAGV